MPVLSFIEPCLPSLADRLPSGADWVHEIKHDGYRLMARRDPVGIRLLTRNGNDWSPRYPLIVEAVNRLKVRSCLIVGEAVACDDNGVAVFARLRRKPSGRHVLLFAFDLLELDGEDHGGSHSRRARRRSPACYADACRACASTSTCRILATWCSGTPARWASKASCRSG
jgi:ATP-dependent DNA ligase